VALLRAKPFQERMANGQFNVHNEWGAIDNLVVLTINSRNSELVEILWNNRKHIDFDASQTKRLRALRKELGLN
jgi:hypothetical protein